MEERAAGTELLARGLAPLVILQNIVVAAIAVRPADGRILGNGNDAAGVRCLERQG